MIFTSGASGASLRGAVVAFTSGAILLGAILLGAILLGANLLGANLLGANLLGANLLGANLLGIAIANGPSADWASQFIVGPRDHYSIFKRHPPINTADVGVDVVIKLCNNRLIGTLPEFIVVQLLQKVIASCRFGNINVSRIVFGPQIKLGRHFD
jgi:uncharacterized protein YjbI with pentapeptide repeats